MRIRRFGALGVTVCTPVFMVVAIGLAAGQTPEPDADTQPQADAYRLFMLGRHLNRAGDHEGAIEAYRAAAELDQVTGEIFGELASLYRGQNRPEEASAAATEALEREPDNVTAHKVLGLVNVAEAGSLGGSEELVRAIEHLEQARGTILPDLEVELNLARLYLATDSTDQAIELLKTLVEDRMGLTQASLLLSSAYEEAGRIDEAVEVLEVVVQTGRPSARALRQLGELYGRLDRWTDAIEAYEGAVARNPRSSGAQRDLASALLQTGQLERGREVLRRLTSMRPDDGSALYRLSEVELELGNFDEAAAAALALIEVEPNGIRGPYALAEVHGRRYDHQAVIATLEPALRVARDNNVRPNQIASLLGRIGVAYEQLQDYAEASRVYAEATELLPSSLAFGARLVQSLVDAGRLADARVALERVQTQHPSDLTLTRLEARLLGDSGDIRAGADVLRALLTADESDPSAHVALAGYYSSYERFDMAVDLLESARQQFPDNLSVLFQLGAVREQSARYGEAEQAFRNILEQNPHHAATLNYLGYMLADRGDRLEESVDLLERAIEIDPHNGAYLDSLGWAYFKLDRLDLAESHLRAASEQMVWNSVIQDHLGDLLSKLGRHEEAIEAWEAALAGDGEQVESSDIERKIADARRQLGRE